jgi:hypothetical protein
MPDREDTLYNTPAGRSVDRDEVLEHVEMVAGWREEEGHEPVHVEILLAALVKAVVNLSEEVAEVGATLGAMG